MKYRCSNCGHNFEKMLKKCPNCGAILEYDIPKPTPKREPEGIKPRHNKKA